MRCRNLFLIFILLTASFTLPAKNLPKGIDWFPGSVEKALILAKKQNKPLFLYWGAIWCPPCNRIRKTIFTRPLFREKVKQFVAVYLDGDTSQADEWGEKLKAESYPTLLILSSQGKELIRLPVQGTADEYVKLMESVVHQNKTITELLESIKKQPAHKISRSIWSHLASHSWFQDKNLNLKKLTLFKMLYKKAPPQYKWEQNTFFLNYLLSLPKPSKERPLTDGDKLIKQFEELLTEKPFEMKLFDKILYWGGYSIIEKIYAKKPANQKKKVEQLLLKIASTRKTYKKITLEKKLNSFYPAVQVYQDKLPDQIKKELIDLIESIDKRITNVQKRYDLTTAAVILLKKAKMYSRAKKLAIKESKGKMAPYYFMNILASIEQDIGNKEVALKWKQRAWERTPQGTQTRFSLGTTYLSGLMTTIPNDTKRVSLLTINIVEEVLSGERTFGQKNQRIFKMLGKSLKKWVKEKGLDKVSRKNRKKALKKISIELKKICNKNVNKTSCLKKLKEYALTDQI